MSGQGMAYNTLVSVSERMFPGITVGLGHNYNTMEYAAVKLGNQVVSSLALQLGRSHVSRRAGEQQYKLSKLNSFEMISLENIK